MARHRMIPGRPAHRLLAGQRMPRSLAGQPARGKYPPTRPGTSPMAINLHGPGMWYATRAAGLVTLGLMTAGRFSSDRWPRFLTAGLHRNISLLVLVFLALHVSTTVLDTFVSIP